MLYYLDCISQELVSIFYRYVLDVDSITTAVGQFVLIDVDGVVLSVAQIDGISADITHELRHLLRS